MQNKRIALFHDLSGFGRNSLSVIMPIMAVFGCQGVAVPTALLSTHTGGFDGFTFLDLTDEMKHIIAHYRALNLNFHAVYSGFLGSEEQIGIVSSFIDTCPDETLIVVDPVMADHGLLYTTYTHEMRLGMQSLCRRADLITPNITEAYFLLDEEYKSPPLTRGECRRIADALREKFACDVVITGVTLSENTVACVTLDNSGEINFHERELIPQAYPGTGDVFTAVLTGKLLSGAELVDATAKAADFVYSAVKRTYQAGTPVREGVLYEGILSELITGFGG